MKHKTTIKILALIGTILVWFPIVFMLFTSTSRLVRSGSFNFDYMLLAELFPVVLLGGGLLAWAAIWAKQKRKEVLWTLGAVLVLLVASQLVAVLTGLASGAVAEGGWQLYLVAGMLIAYDVAVVVLGIIGIILFRNLFRKY